MKGTIKKYDYICRIITRKKERLGNVIRSYGSCTPYEIKKYYDELDDLSYLLYEGVRLEKVNLKEYARIKKDADFFEVTVDGNYCKLAKVHKFPYSSVWIVYITPFKQLKSLRIF